MGTTIVSTLVCGDKVYIGHVGDSRCYRVRSSGVEQLTRDHSLLEDYKEAKPDMTEEEERNFPHKNVITRALGMRETVQVDIRGSQIESGDIYVLCSDGLSGMVTDDSICKTVAEAKSLERAVAELVDQANRSGGTDNITVLLLQCMA
jgi:protein phosphatase